MFGVWGVSLLGRFQRRCIWPAVHENKLQFGVLMVLFRKRKHRLHGTFVLFQPSTVLLLGPFHSLPVLFEHSPSPLLNLFVIFIAGLVNSIFPGILVVFQLRMLSLLLLGFSQTYSVESLVDSWTHWFEGRKFEVEGIFLAWVLSGSG